MSCGCSKPSGGPTDFKIMGGRRRRTSKKTKKTKKTKQMKKTKLRKKIRRRKTGRKSKRFLMRGGMNSDLTGSQTTNVTNFASKMLGTPFTPNGIADQPANKSFGEGNFYVV